MASTTGAESVPEEIDWWPPRMGGACALEHPASDAIHRASPRAHQTIAVGGSPVMFGPRVAHLCEPSGSARDRGAGT